ncbi:13977_t:CDS:2, partial [Racocetra fulgida]
APSADIKISTDGNNAGFLITNVLPGDYNYDGILDILVMGQVSPGDSSKQLYMRVYMGTGNSTFDPNYYNVPSSTAQQPIPLDFYGSMKVDLLGHQFGDSSHISIWKNVFNATTRTLFEVVQMPVNGAFQNCTISDPHSNAFIDLNGDCLAGFTFSQSGNLPDGTGQISFADMDMVYPVCSSGGTCKIHIAYNKQIPLCSGSERDYNFDGYPDILVISSSGSTYRASLFQSVSCTSQKCNSLEVESQRRTFTRVVDGASALNDITDARSAAFMDLDEDVNT